MVEQEIKHIDLNKVKVLDDGEIFAWIGYVSNEAGPALKDILEHLSLTEKRSEFISPCLVDLSGMSVDSLPANLRNQKKSSLDLREYISLVSSLDEDVPYAKNGALLYGGEFMQFFDTDTHQALMFAHASVYPGTISSFWFSTLAFAKHQNYFLMENYEKWFMACKHTPKD